MRMYIKTALDPSITCMTHVCICVRYTSPCALAARIRLRCYFVSPNPQAPRDNLKAMPLPTPARYLRLNFIRWINGVGIPRSLHAIERPLCWLLRVLKFTCMRLSSILYPWPRRTKRVLYLTWQMNLLSMGVPLVSRASTWSNSPLIRLSTRIHHYRRCVHTDRFYV